MEGVVKWFEQRGEIPLLPPFRVREYGPLTDDPDRPVDEHFSDAIRGVAFAIEYCDSHGWMSTRTVRCLSLDPRHPACLDAYCHVRGRAMRFRVDRIISIVNLRSGGVVSNNEHLALLAPYLPHEEPGAELRALIKLQRATRNGVFALLQVAMADGKLNEQARDVVLEYVKAEAEAVAAECPMVSSELIGLWLDNLAPPVESVTASVAELLSDKDKFTRLLPWLLKVARCQESFPALQDSLRELMAAVRQHFRGTPRGFPSDLRATS